MLKNYFKTTVRSLRKNKVFSFINIYKRDFETY